MKKKFYSGLALILVLSFVLSFILASLPPVFAKEYTIETFMVELAQKMGQGDNKGAEDFIVKNKKIAKETFDLLLPYLDSQLSQGKEDEETQVSLLLCITIATVFQSRWQDSSLMNSLNIIAEKYAGKQGGDDKPLPPTSTGIYAEMDQLEMEMGQGKFDDTTVPRVESLKNRLAEQKDYRGIIRLMEIVARFLDNVGANNRSIEIRTKMLTEVLPKMEGDDPIKAKLYLRLANSYFENNDYNNAEKYFKEAVNISVQKKYMTNFISFISHISLCSISLFRMDVPQLTQYLQLLFNQTNFKKAFDEVDIKEQQDFYLFLNGFMQLGETMRLFGRFFIQSGQVTQGKEFLNQGYDIFDNTYKEIRNILSSATSQEYPFVISFLIVVALEKGNFSLELEEFEQAYNTFDELAQHLYDFMQMPVKYPGTYLTMEDNKLIAFCSRETARAYLKGMEHFKNDKIKYEEYKSRAQYHYQLAFLLYANTYSMKDHMDISCEYYGFLLDYDKIENEGEFLQLMDNLEKTGQDIEHTYGLFNISYLKARYYKKKGNIKKSRDEYIKSIDFMEKAVSFMAAHEQQKQILSVYGEKIYQEASEILIQNNESQLAFEYLERLKAKEFAQSIDLQQVRVKDETVQDALNNVQKIKTENTSLEEEISREKEKPKEFRDEKKIQRLSQTMAKNKSEFYENINIIRQTNPDYERLVAVKPSSFAKIQKLIPEDTIMIQYFPSETKLYIFLVTNKTFAIKTVDVQRSELDKLVNNYIRLIKTAGDDYNRTGREIVINSWKTPPQDKTVQSLMKLLPHLYSILIEPIEPEIKDKKILAIIPTGLLYYLPFHSLAKPDSSQGLRFLVEDKEIACLSSGDLLEVVSGSPPQGKLQHKILAIGNPDGSLQNAEEEVKEIQQILPQTQVYIGKEATKDRVKNMPAGFSILHFATHGYLDSKDVNQSFILMAGNDDEGKLKTGEIFEIPLENANLVTLSACQTAMGEGKPGSEIASLASAFSIAGTSSILASLWSVSDESTRYLMIEFYKNLKAGKSKSESLRLAQLKLMKTPRFAHPYFWAPFILIGDWR